MAGCGLWLGKNWVLTGNPVYPLAASLFDGETRTAEKTAQWERAHQVPRDKEGRRWSVQQAWDAVALIGWRSAWLSPIVVPFFVMGFLVKDARRRVIWFAAAAFWIGLVWWAASHRIDRFLLPVWPFFALIAGVGTTWSAAGWWRRAVLALFVWGLVANWLVVSSGVMGVDRRFLVQLDRLRDDTTWGEPDEPKRVNPVHSYLNHTVGEGGRVLLVGDAQPFDLQVPTLYNTCFDDCWFEKLTATKSKDERIKALSELGITHVYIHWNELARYRSEGNYGYSDYVTEAVIRELIDEQEILAEPQLSLPGWGEVFSVRSSDRGT
jgi:hypothetical protein